MSFTSITDEELENMGVTGLPDIPELTTEEMQAQFDEYPQFLKDKFKTHISEEEADTAAGNIGAKIPNELADMLENLTEEQIAALKKIQPILDELAKRTKDLKDWQDAADANFSPTELNTGAFHADATEVTVPTVDTSDVSGKAASTEFVNNKMQAIGAGDMAKSIYDPNNRGRVEKVYRIGDSIVDTVDVWDDSDYPYVEEGDSVDTVMAKINKNLYSLKTNVASQLADGVMSKTDKKKLDEITEGAEAPVYATCSTSGSTVEKAITVQDAAFELKEGALIAVQFSNTNTATNPKFNVNNTGAYSVKLNSGYVTSTTLEYAGVANIPIMYMFIGDAWLYLGGVHEWEPAISSINAKIYDSNDSYKSTKAYSVGDRVIHDNILYKCITACSAGSWSTNQSCFTVDTITKAISADSRIIETGDDAYSTTKAYKVGDRCIKNDTLYKCITACSAGSWATNKTCFEVDSLTSAVTTLNASLSWKFVAEDVVGTSTVTPPTAFKELMIDFDYSGTNLTILIPYALFKATRTYRVGYSGSTSSLLQAKATTDSDKKLTFDMQSNAQTVSFNVNVMYR